MNDAELALRIEFLQKAHEDDVKARKYTHNMIEDLVSKIGNLEQSAVRFELYMTHRDVMDDGLKGLLNVLDSRMRVVERLVWVAVGGMVVIAGLTSIVGTTIINLLKA